MNPSHSIKILIIDNTQSTLIDLSAAVHETMPEATVLSAQAGKAGIELAVAQDPDVIVLDLANSGTSSIELCRTIKAEGLLKDIPVLFLAEYRSSDPANRFKALHAGADGFLNRPLDAAETKAQIQAMARIKAAVQWRRTEQNRLDAQKIEHTKTQSESEANYRHLFESNPHPMWVYDLKTLRFLAVNEAAVQSYGYSRDEFLSMTIADIRPPEDVPRLLQNVTSVTAGLDKAGVWRHRKKDGTIIDVEITSHTLEFAGCNAELVVAHDVTDRIRAEERAEIMRICMDHAGDCMYLVSPNGQLLYANKLACKLLGYFPSELLTLSVFDIDPDFPPENWLKHWEKLKQRQTLIFETHNRTKEGLVIPVEVNANFIRAAGQEFNFAFTRDITERKRTEEALRMSEEKHRVLYEHSPVAYQSLDIDGCFLDVNPFWLTTLGYERSEVIGRWFGDFLHPDFVDRFQENFSEFKRQGSVHDVHFRIRRKDGYYIDVSFEGNVGYNLDGTFRQTYCAFKDITQHLAASSKLLLESRRAQALLELPVLAESMDETAFMQHGQEIAEDLTQSQITFIHFVHEDQQTIELVTWSRRTRQHFCQASYDSHYPLSQAGIWADALRQCRPVVFNDYAGYAHKRGLPNGHAPLRRLISVPVIEDGKVVMLTGVGNKNSEYTPMDVETVQFVSNAIWSIVRKRRDSAALHASEERYRGIVESQLDAVCRWTADTSLTFANTNYRTLFGLQPAAPLGMSWLEFLPEPDRQHVADICRDLVQHPRKVSCEHQVTAADGSTRWYHWIDTPLFDDEGELLEFQSVGRDTTERKQAETERTLLATAIDQAGETIVITEPDGTIRYVNPAFTALTGYSQEEAIGQHTRILKSGAHDHTFYQKLWETITSGQVWQGRMVNKRKDSTLFSEAVTISPVMDGTGQIISFAAVKRDITAHLQAEEEKTKLQRQLHQAQRLESIGRLAGGVAHDFNNMLSIILGCGESILEQLSPQSPLVEDVKDIIQAGERSATLTRQLLAFSRKQTLQPVVLNLNDVVCSIEKMLRRLLGEDIELILELGSTIGNVRVDPGQVEQIVMNLTINARDAMPTGGRLLIETSMVELDDSYAENHPGMRPGHYIQLAVSDTGMGMDQEVVSQIFDPFFTTKEMGRGTGLGLATVYGIIKQSSGYITVYSEPGQGTAFKIYFPRIEADQERVAAKAAVVSRPEGSEHILVVEDEKSLRRFMQITLSRQGYAVTLAANGVEALSLVEEAGLRPDLIITDVIMPKMSGMQLIERLHQSRPHLKALFMSGYTDDTIAQHGVLNAETPFIHKPFTVHNLAIKIREILDKNG